MTTIPGRPDAGARSSAERAAMWDGPAGEHRITHADQDDNEVSRHNERMRAAARVGLTDHMLDIGCGTGQSTRDATHAAQAGSVLGVDVSARMLERARVLTGEQGLGNVWYRRADAQSHRWAPGRFDLLISRFGAMFFTDPVGAFTNLGRALRPGARLVLLVWPDYDPQRVGGDDPPGPPRPRCQPGPRSPSRSASRPRSGTSWAPPVSPGSASPACTSPSTTAGTPLLPLTSSAASG